LSVAKASLKYNLPPHLKRTQIQPFLLPPALQQQPMRHGIGRAGLGLRDAVAAEMAERLPQCEILGTAALNLDPQWVEAAAFGWLAACWFNRLPGNPHRATGASKPCILGAGHYA